MVLDLIRRLADKGLAVLVISHNLNDVFEVADRLAVLHLGRMVAQGQATDFDRQSAVELMTTGTSIRLSSRATGDTPPAFTAAPGGGSEG
jgi:ABC-type sugar transport system ATPase subunit